MKETKTPQAEKCGICFFVDNKAVFTLVKTKDKEFNDSLLKSTYFRKNTNKR